MALVALMVLYEWGALAARDAVQNAELLAPSAIAGLLAWFGISGLWVPPVAFTVALLLWQRLSGDSWRMRLYVFPSMLGEALIWALPLLVLSWLFPRADSFPATRMWTQVRLAIGAGVYEELVFRLLLIGALAWLATEIFNVRGSQRYWLAAALAAGAFSAFHFQPLGREPFAWEPFGFRLLAGGYLALIYLWRGLGVCGIAHAAYNVLIVMTRATG